MYGPTTLPLRQADEEETAGFEPATSAFSFIGSRFRSSDLWVAQFQRNCVSLSESKKYKPFVRSVNRCRAFAPNENRTADARSASLDRRGNRTRGRDVTRPTPNTRARRTSRMRSYIIRTSPTAASRPSEAEQKFTGSHHRSPRTFCANFDDPRSLDPGNAPNVVTRGISPPPRMYAYSTYGGSLTPPTYLFPPGMQLSTVIL